MSQSDSTPRSWTRQVGECSVSGCDRDAEKRGYCGPHYQRLRKHGDPLHGGPLRPWRRQHGSLCEVEGCDSVARKRGWCMKHYDRWMKHGDPLHEPRPQGHKRVHDGYVLVMSGGCAPIESEHRLMWEARHGPLLPGQNIHHKNGNRADNRYENFELWDTLQPAGQRPEDKVEFAIEMLRRYAPSLLPHP